MSAYSTATTQWGTLTFGLVAGESGLSRVILPYEWQDPAHPAHRYPVDRQFLRPWLDQFDAYWANELVGWVGPLDFHGTAFQTKVWQALQDILPGSVQTYGEVARRLGNSRAVRAVASAIAHNPLPIIVPCHRVIGARSTLIGYQGGLNLKEKLLRHEGVHHINPTGHARFAF
ncbi:MAG: cysteine methyltransferase [Sulfobacillus acidophilus]|uniref:methylated-DNA--[protein]-cysteine S-methyltransferase n=1 Tax=Sulfobacillus acidophilus TaxID=53633 RepID=A0A2T2WL29_9FIRM|nr:MAG: cysteine methyltransferase [Sulfobacillus acidophilus]